MNHQQTMKQKKTKAPEVQRKRHDPARTTANKARRLEKDRLAKLRKAQEKMDHKADHGSARFMKRARLSFLPGPKARAVKKLTRQAPIHFTHEREFFQLGQRAYLREVCHGAS